MEVCKKYLMRTILSLLLFSFAFSGLAQTSPTSDNGGSIAGEICLTCTIENPAYARDGSTATFTQFELSAGISAYGEIAYSFPADLPSSSIINLIVAFPDLASDALGVYADIATYQKLEIDLIDAAGTVIFTYDAGNPSSVQVLESGSNLVKIELINSYSQIRTIGIRAGALLSPTGDVRLYEINYELSDFTFSSRNLGSGYYNGSSLVSVTVNENVEHPEKVTFSPATSTYDVNSSFTSFRYLLNANIESAYLYSTYDWSGATFSGAQKDVYFLFENANRATVGDILLLYESDLIGIELQYADGSTALLDKASPLLEANIAAIGSGRFTLKVNIPDQKRLQAVEVRFSPFASAGSELKLYAIYLQATASQILPVDFLGMDVELHQGVARVEWATAAEIDNDYYLLKQLDKNFREVAVWSIPGAGKTHQRQDYIHTATDLEPGVNYFVLHQYDFDGTNTYLSTKSVVAAEEAPLTIFPNPARGNIYLDGAPSGSSYRLFNMNGQLLKRDLVAGNNDISDLPAGVYYLQAAKPAISGGALRLIISP